MSKRIVIELDDEGYALWTQLLEDSNALALGQIGDCFTQAELKCWILKDMMREKAPQVAEDLAEELARDPNDTDWLCPDAPADVRAQVLIDMYQSNQ